jgi:DNA-binding transcriptional regulator YiaG
MKNHPNRSKVNDWPKFLKEFRASRGMTQRQLANALQTSLRNIENWESGLANPPQYLKKALSTL